MPFRGRSAEDRSGGLRAAFGRDMDNLRSNPRRLALGLLLIASTILVFSKDVRAWRRAQREDSE